jgi:hypothetical protein
MCPPEGKSVCLSIPWQYWVTVSSRPREHRCVLKCPWPATSVSYLALRSECDMEVLTAFSWCVPGAFLNALDCCCFNAGDVLYSDAAAYHGTWKEAVKKLRWSIQIKKATAAAARDGEAIFDANWKRGRVTVQCTDYRSGAGLSRLIETTQGRVYHTLAKGDPTLLEGEDFLPVQRCEHRLVELVNVAPEEGSPAPLIVRTAIEPAVQWPQIPPGKSGIHVQGMLF